MALVINQSKDRYETTVKMKQAGSSTSESFKVILKKISQPQFEELVNTGKRDRDICDEVLLGWSGIKTEDGTVLEFANDEHRKAVMDVSGFCGSIVAKMIEDNTGGRIKNS